MMRIVGRMDTFSKRIGQLKYLSLGTMALSDDGEGLQCSKSSQYIGFYELPQQSIKLEVQLLPSFSTF